MPSSEDTKKFFDDRIEENYEIQNPDVSILRRLALAAKAVMDDLEYFGPNIVPHLIDDDDNDGERLRELIGEALAQEQTFDQHADQAIAVVADDTGSIDRIY